MLKKMPHILKLTFKSRLLLHWFNTRRLKYAKTYIKVHMIARIHVDTHSSGKKSY